MLWLQEERMADVIVKKIDEMEGYQGGKQFVYAGRSLGVTAWGMNVLNLPPEWAGYPDHDHASDAQEEVYVVLSGAATLHAEGSTWDLAPGTIARVGARQKR